MPINKNEITKEMIEKAMQCKTVDELIALAKTEGFEITNEEAEGTGRCKAEKCGRRREGLLCGWLRIADARKLIHSPVALLQVPVLLTAVDFSAAVLL